MTERLGAPDRPLRIAIIGAGPAGLYAAECLLRNPDITLTIDVFNRFPTPLGLVRYAGRAEQVAPRRIVLRFLTSPVEAMLADLRLL